MSHEAKDIAVSIARMNKRERAMAVLNIASVLCDEAWLDVDDAIRHARTFIAGVPALDEPAGAGNECGDADFYRAPNGNVAKNGRADGLIVRITKSTIAVLGFEGIDVGAGTLLPEGSNVRLRVADPNEEDPLYAVDAKGRKVLVQSKDYVSDQEAKQ